MVGGGLQRVEGGQGRVSISIGCSGRTRAGRRAERMRAGGLCQLAEGPAAGLFRAMCQAPCQVLYLQVKTHEV